MNKPIVIAFDFDGVIADTIQMLKKTFSDFIKKYSIRYSEDLFEKYNGVKLPDMIADLRNQFCIEATVEELLSEYEFGLKANADTVMPIEKADNTLKYLKKQGYGIIVSSSASKEYIETFLTKHNLRQYFDELFSAESTVYAKPDERYYLRIKECYEKYDVIAVEDSDNGLIAAFNAGMKTVFYNESSRVTSVPYHFSVSSLDQIIDVIEKQILLGFFISNDNVDIVLKDIHPVFSDREKESIEEIWNKRPKHIFNGTVLAYSGCHYENGKLIVNCYLTEYKYVYSIRKRITPIAVSGICLDKNDNTIVSIRNKVTDYSGCYELIPSGGIDSKYVQNDVHGYKRQLLDEFCEEIGSSVSKEKVLGIDVLGICFDSSSNTMDICMKIHYADSFVDLNLDGNNDEYSSQSTLIEDVISMKEYLEDKDVVITSKMILSKI